jgi:hypothetical protein
LDTFRSLNTPRQHDTTTDNELQKTQVITVIQEQSHHGLRILGFWFDPRSNPRDGIPALTHLNKHRRAAACCKERSTAVTTRAKAPAIRRSVGITWHGSEVPQLVTGFRRASLRDSPRLARRVVGHRVARVCRLASRLWCVATARGVSYSYLTNRSTPIGLDAPLPLRHAQEELRREAGDDG